MWCAGRVLLAKQGATSHKPSSDTFHPRPLHLPVTRQQRQQHRQSCAAEPSASPPVSNEVAPCEPCMRAGATALHWALTHVN